MRMQSLPACRALAARLSWALGAGGAGSLAVLILARRPSATRMAVVAVAVAVAATLIESVCRALPRVITATSNLMTARTRAKADAGATSTLASARAELARAGLDPAKTAPAAEMLRLLCLDPDLPKDRRPADNTLVKLQETSLARASTTGTSPGPETADMGNRAAKDARPRCRASHRNKRPLRRPDLRLPCASQSRHLAVRPPPCAHRQPPELAGPLDSN
jgi:hypothetical protein